MTENGPDFVADNPSQTDSSDADVKSNDIAQNTIAPEYQELAKNKGWMNDDGNIKSDAVLKGYAELEKRLGKSIILPDSDDKEGLAKIYDKLGRPESPEGYEINTDGLLAGDENIPRVLKAFHDLGLTKAQAQGVMDLYMDVVEGGVRVDLQKQLSDLKIEYGERFEVAKEGVQRIATQLFGDDPDTDNLATMIIGAPRLFKMFDKINSMIGEDSKGAAGLDKTTGAVPDKAKPLSYEEAVREAFSKANKV